MTASTTVSSRTPDEVDVPASIVVIAISIRKYGAPSRMIRWWASRHDDDSSRFALLV